VAKPTTTRRAARSSHTSVHLHEQAVAYQQGLSSWDDAHLLTRVMCHSEDNLTTQKRCLRAARRLLDTVGMLGLVQALEGRPDTLLRFGLTEPQLDRLTLAYELVARCQRVQTQTRTQIKSSQDADALFRPELALLDHEELHVIVLDTRSHIVEYTKLYKGTVNSSTIRTAEVLRIAVLRNCPRLILAHNHPSQDCTPSQEDRALTLRIVKAAQLLDIEILDHLVIAYPSSTSLREVLQW
jgi:DNA repair protein RadC